MNGRFVLTSSLCTIVRAPGLDESLVVFVHSSGTVSTWAENCFESVGYPVLSSGVAYLFERRVSAYVIEKF